MTMITRLEEIPALTESWLAPLREADPETFEELAESLVINASAAPADEVKTPDASLAAAVGALNLIGKEVGAFRFADGDPSDPAGAIAAFDARIRENFDIEGDMQFIGAYGQDLLFVTGADTGILQQEGDQLAAIPVARNFAAFLIGQCNAFDSYKKFIVKDDDDESYFADARSIDSSATMPQADILTIFECQLKA